MRNKRISSCSSATLVEHSEIGEETDHCHRRNVTNVRHTHQSDEKPGIVRHCMPIAQPLQ